MSSNLQCSFIGLGAMGKNMAGHIAKHVESLGYPSLLVFNRTQAKAEELKKIHPVKVATSLEEVAKKSDIIFSCLLNDTAVEETVNDLVPHLKSGTLLVEQSTISPKMAEKLAEKVSQVGATYLACPVMGPPAKAAAAELIVLIAGGDSNSRSKALSILIPAIGKKKIELGDTVGQSLRLKLCGNFVVTSTVEMLAEYMTLAEASGVGQDKAQELLDNFLPGTMVATYGSRMSQQTFTNEIHFPVSSIKKDVNHIINLAKESNASIPITHKFLEHCNTVQEKHGDFDLTSVVGVLREEAGLPFIIEKK
ncbi:hypothetical protein RMATCC62417_17125 [Rhizopus microsporus]|nr:hypothetical protein RMATCC62417_17125 [Rhizopus microsporus]